MKYLILCMLFAVSTVSAEERLVLLKDGSQIQAEIISYAGGVYTVRSSSLGILKLPDGKVQSISSLSARPLVRTMKAPVRQSTDASLGRSIEQIQSGIANNPGVMANILQLQNDPQMQAILADPAVMRAVQSFDLEALAKNPRIQALMNNQKVKKIQSQLK